MRKQAAPLCDKRLELRRFISPITTGSLSLCDETYASRNYKPSMSSQRRNVTSQAEKKLIKLLRTEESLDDLGNSFLARET